MEVLKKQVQTARGLIYVEAIYSSVLDALGDGYELSFEDRTFGPVYCRHKDINHRTFALIEGNPNYPWREEVSL